MSNKDFMTLTIVEQLERINKISTLLNVTRDLIEDYKEELICTTKKLEKLEHDEKTTLMINDTFAILNNIDNKLMNACDSIGDLREGLVNDVHSKN